MMNGETQLHLRHRPSTFEEVIGHDAAVNALLSLIERGSSRAFLLHGPSGVGKTTLARIIARKMGCLDKDVMELDAATHTGIDSMRALMDSMLYLPFGKGKIRALIVDEAHGLSRQSWDSLLKSVEEPPAHVLWLFCTTMLDKVPITIRTRCSVVGLKAMKDAHLLKLITDVGKREGIKLPNGFFDMIVKEANGSARQALVNLSLVRDVSDKTKAAELLRSALDSDAHRALCRFLLNRGSWAKAMELYAQLENVPAETTRIGVCNYMAVVAKNAKTERDVVATLQIMEAFKTPYDPAIQSALLLRSIGQALFSE